MSGVYMQSGGPSERDTTLRDLLSVIFKYKWLIIGITAMALVVVGYRTLTSPVTFSADATLMLDRQGARSSVLDQGGRALPWVEVVESEVQVLQSAPVLQGALVILDEQFPDGHGMNLDKLSRNIGTGVIGESNVIYVTGRSGRPELAIGIANAVATSYQAHHEKMFKIPDPSGFLRSQSDSLYSAMTNLQERRSALFEQIGVTDVESQERALINERSEQRRTLAHLKVRIARIEMEIRNAEEALRSGSRSLPFPENTGNVQVQHLGQAMRDLQVHEAELENLLSKYTEKHPEVIELRREVETLRALVDRQIRENLTVKRNQLAAATAEQDKLTSNIAEIDERLRELPELVRELDLIGAQLATVSQQYDDLGAQIVNTAVSSASHRDYGVQLLSAAVGARQNQKGDPVRLALGPLLALLAGIGLAFYLENLDHSFRSREDIEQHLEIPVLASFPEVDIAEDEGGGKSSSRIPFQKKGQSQ